MAVGQSRFKPTVKVSHLKGTIYFTKSLGKATDNRFKAKFAKGPRKGQFKPRRSKASLRAEKMARKIALEVARRLKKHIRYYITRKKQPQTAGHNTKIPIESLVQLRKMTNENVVTGAGGKGRGTIGYKDMRERGTSVAYEVLVNDYPVRGKALWSKTVNLPSALLYGTDPHLIPRSFDNVGDRGDPLIGTFHPGAKAKPFMSQARKRTKKETPGIVRKYKPVARKIAKLALQ